MRRLLLYSWKLTSSGIMFYENSIESDLMARSLIVNIEAGKHRAVSQPLFSIFEGTVIVNLVHSTSWLSKLAVLGVRKGVYEVQDRFCRDNLLLYHKTQSFIWILANIPRVLYDLGSFFLLGNVMLFNIRINFASLTIKIYLFTEWNQREDLTSLFDTLSVFNHRNNVPLRIEP